MMKHHLLLWIALAVLLPEPMTGQLSCYQCNVELTNRFTNDCTDPYTPSPLDHLVSCPENEPHHCMKAMILYNNIHATVRACVPSRLRSSYCEDTNFVNFPSAAISCEFCEVDGCNHSTSRAEPYGNLVLGLVIVLIVQNF